MSNLVELMANTRLPYHTFINKESCKILLSVVKEHIGLAAMICPECNGSGKYYKPHGYCRRCADPNLDCDEHTDNKLNCPKCKGFGVIARTEGDVCLKK